MACAAACSYDVVHGHYAIDAVSPRATPGLASTSRLALRGDLLDLVGDPGDVLEGGAAVRFERDGWLLIENGRIVGRSSAALSEACGSDGPDASWTRIDRRGCLVMPGFIDSHVHSAQIDVLASHGTELLDWLNTYTFPAEARQRDPEVAADTARRFVDALLAHGTTTAMVFPTVHKASVDALFEAAQAQQMRLLAGKVMMDRHAPPELLDDVANAERDSVDLIERWHGRGRLAYAVTPRFAPTSTPAQLALAGRLLAAYPGLYAQTHVAENRAEVQWVRELFPEARSYLDVYQRHGLLGPRSVLAHGIWFDGDDRARLADTGSLVAHCPSSNLFLGSGLMDWQALRRQGVGVLLASDVGGGTSLCLLRALAQAYQVQALQGQRLTAWQALHAATRGAAQQLGLAHEIGSLQVGGVADLCVWDWAVGPLAGRRDQLARNLHERVFAWMTLGDERNLRETWIAGQCRWQRGADPAH
jgi:guanine deaminase